MISGCSALLLASILAASPLAPAALTYVESSTGLTQPGLEGGNTEVEMADVNGDGHVDLASVGDHGNPGINSAEEGILVWLGDGRGNWSHRHFGVLGYGGIAVGDLDGDGLADVAYGVHHNYGGNDLGDQRLEAALGNGTGFSWVPWDDGLDTHGQSWGMFATDLCDLEGDGDLDIASSGFGASDGLHAYLNRRDGSWDRSFGFIGGNSGNDLQCGDVDGDGVPDIGTSKQEGATWLGDGDGFFFAGDAGLPVLPEYDYRDGVSLGDVDGDGRDDLAACNVAGDPEVWLRRAGSWLAASAGLPADHTCEFTQLHDMDGDGRVDLVLFGARRVRVFAGDGAGHWSPLADFTTPDTPGNGNAFRVGGDVDHNGRPDIVLVDEKRISTFEYRNQLRVYKESSPAPALTARVVRPGPNRTLLAGAATFVEWAGAVPAGQTATATLDFSGTGPSGPWTRIVAAAPNSGRYQWVVPATTCADCRVRVTLGTGSSSVIAVGPAFRIARRGDAIGLAFDDADTLRWTDALPRDVHHVYRGDWAAFVSTGAYTQDPAQVPAAARFCGLAAPAAGVDDPFVPAPGRLAFYLVTAVRRVEDGQQAGVRQPMAESPLGQRSDARMRANAKPCPAPPPVAP